MALAVTFTFRSDLLIFVKSAFFFNGKVMNIFTFFLTLGGLCLFFVCGASAVDPHRVSVMEGDTVTLQTNVESNQQDKMIWFFGVNRIAVINKDQIKICEDDKCKERFRDRLKLNNQTGSLTIMNITNTDSGDYTLKNTSRNTDNIFSVTVQGVSAAERDDMKRKSVKEGESVTLDTRVIKNPNDVMRWYFNNISIAEITGDQSKICSDDECKERFRDRLKLDHQTGSLTIMNITNTDSGLYKLQINSRRGSVSTFSTRIFIVAVSGFLGVGADGVSVFVMEEDSVTLHSDVKTNQQQFIKWFMNDTRIAVITGDLSEICTDVQCKERFRDRLKLDHQTGSLTIRDIRTTDSGLYHCEISGNTREIILGVVVHHVSAAQRDEIKRKSVKEGESVTLDTHVTNKPNNLMWHFNETRIAVITGDQSKICTDVQCEERFRDRLKLDHQTGSLTIMNTRTTDSGVYQQVSNGNNSKSEKTFNVTVHGFFRDGTDGVSVFLMERDSVTFQTGVETNQQDKIKWYFVDTRIAQINGDLSKICTDVQCNAGTERFRDRLKMDHQTGSLTIMNITNTDSGLYQLRISSKNNGEVDTTFYFAIHDVSAAKQDEMKEGGNVTLYTDVIKIPNGVMTWHFDNILIAGDQSKICTEDQCKEIFRDRLKLNNQTGSLTIMNTRTTDSGLYKLEINSSRVSIIRTFNVTFHVARTNAAVIVGGAVSCVLLIAAVAVGVYCCQKRSTKTKQKDTTGQGNLEEENDEAKNFLPEQNCSNE